MTETETFLKQNLAALEEVQKEVQNLQDLLKGFQDEVVPLIELPHIFVFGSNERGAHGAGAAAFAVAKHGAILGQGIGIQGTSYGIPTKNHSIKTLPITAIIHYVGQFQAFAEEHPDLSFDVTRIGCGLAGYTDQDMAPLFLKAPENCYFPEEWKTLLGPSFKYHDLH